MRVFFGFLASMVGLMPVAAVTPTAAPTLAYEEDFPDPFVLTDGDLHYAFATQTGPTNVPVISSSNLESWSWIGDALPDLPGWADSGKTWSPAVVKHNRGYLLYYTTKEKRSGRQCISVATAMDPAEPFVDSTRKPLVCQVDKGGSIDPYPFVDKDGKLYLLWKNDGNAVQKPTALWSRRLASNGQGWHSESAETLLLKESNWHVPIAGPALVRAQDGYFLFYGGKAYNTPASGIGYATCKGPLGPCTDKAPNNAWLETGDTDAVGPHGPTVFTDRRRILRIGFSGWKGTVGYPSGKRAFWIGQLKFNNGQPSL